MNNIAPEVTAQPVLAQQTSEQQPVQQLNNTQNQATENEDPNWRSFREARKKDVAEREAAQKKAQEKEAEVAALKAAMEAAFSKGSPQQQQSYYQESHDETEDERIEKKVQAAIAAREREYEKSRLERERSELPQRLSREFPDYASVVNEENGAYLEYHHPELYRSLLRQPESFESCSDIYKVVKKLVPNAGTSKREAEKANANFAKPKSIASTGLTQTGEAVGSSRLSEDKKAENWARMQRLLKGVG